MAAEGPRAVAPRPGGRLSPSLAVSDPSESAEAPAGGESRPSSSDGTLAGEGRAVALIDFGLARRAAAKASRSEVQAA